MKIALAISTVGRPRELDCLLASIEEQSHRPAQIVVADQSDADDVKRVVHEWAHRLPVRRIASSRGASRGRNDALSALEGDWDAVGFPDDDVIYPSGALKVVVEALSGLDGLTGRLVDEHMQGRRLKFGSERVPITKHNVWTHAIEATMFLRKELLDRVGRFDETVGVGCLTPWQSGEGTDLLLRALSARARIAFDPKFAVIDSPGDPQLSHSAKVRRYARGAGYVARRHYGRRYLARMLVRPVGAAALACLRGDLDSSSMHIQSCVGRFEGIYGRAFPAFFSPLGEGS